MNTYTYLKQGDVTTCHDLLITCSSTRRRKLSTFSTISLATRSHRSLLKEKRCHDFNDWGVVREVGPTSLIDTLVKSRTRHLIHQSWLWHLLSDNKDHGLSQCLVARLGSNPMNLILTITLRPYGLHEDRGENDI